MEIRYDVVGKLRKNLVEAIAEITGAKAIYKGVPTCNYEVDYFIVDKYGTLIFDDSADSEEVERLLEELEIRGFVAAQREDTEESLSKPKQQEILQPKASEFSISIPRDKVNIGNLENLLNAKKLLICKALGIDSISVDVEETRVNFPWFSETPDLERVEAYTHFIAAICKMSMEQKRISPVKKTVDNEKYAFRCFLLRLGFIGAEYKKERMLLLENLSGSTAFKNGKGGDKE